MIFPTLYGRSTTGKIKQWNVSVDNLEDGSASITVIHGYSDGKKQQDYKVISSGKNIGKANETTPYEQACSEARSALNKKRDEGYSESEDSIKEESSGFFFQCSLTNGVTIKRRSSFLLRFRPNWMGSAVFPKRKMEQFFFGLEKENHLIFRLR